MPKPPPQEKKQEDSGAPAYMTTFADLMSLLMCFFVLMLSFSEMDRQKFKIMAGSFKEAFGVQRNIKVWEIAGNGTLGNGREFCSPGADGIRADVDGNIWAASSPGVRILAPSGEQIGAIRLPETCANVCFGGRRRNRLFMTASQSLYAVYVGTRGAHIS